MNRLAFHAELRKMNSYKAPSDKLITGEWRDAVERKQRRKGRRKERRK